MTTTTTFSMLKHCYGRYLHWNEVRPMLTKCATAGTLMGLGDLLCQKIKTKFTDKKRLDLGRLRSFTTYGFIVSGPMLYFTYNKILPYIAPGTSKLSIAKKLLFSQTAFTLVSMSAFYTAIPVLEGQSPMEGMKEIQHKLWPTMLTNWKVWPILQFINFTCVPLNLQAAYVAFFSLFFNVYLSFMKFVIKRPDELQAEGVGFAMAGSSGMSSVMS